MPLYLVQKNIYFKKTLVGTIVIKTNGDLLDLRFLNLLHDLNVIYPNNYLFRSDQSQQDFMLLI